MKINYDMEERYVGYEDSHIYIDSINYFKNSLDGLLQQFSRPFSVVDILHSIKI